MSDWERSQSPPDYKEAIASSYASNQSSPGGFLTTNELQVEAIGYNTNEALTGMKKLENISVYTVESGVPTPDAKYISLRPKRSSNSCALVRTTDPHQNALISTVYRWGPGRHPRMRILPRHASVSVEQAIDDDHLGGEMIEVQSRSMVSRTQTFDTSLGNFEWRYGSREEKKACDADSLLILERMDCGANGSRPKSGIKVAQLIRSSQFRTPGSVRYSGGNGGRLMMDLRMWQGEKHVEADAAEAFFVASCILMLKREADRFVDNNLAAVV